jgi:heme oxygenase
MPYITSVEEIGYDRGKAEEAQSLILRLLNRKLGVLPDRTIDRVNKLSITRLESLGEALLDFSEIDDLTTWLDNHSG